MWPDVSSSLCCSVGRGAQGLSRDARRALSQPTICEMTATRLEAVGLAERLGLAVCGGRLSAVALRSPRSAGLCAVAPKLASPWWQSQDLCHVSLTLHGTCSFHHFSRSLKAIFILCLNYLSPLYLHVAGIKVLKI